MCIGLHKKWVENQKEISDLKYQIGKRLSNHPLLPLCQKGGNVPPPIAKGRVERDFKKFISDLQTDLE